MCTACQSSTLQTRANAGLPPLAFDRQFNREEVAKMLALQDGICPDTLVANTLDEEPFDGLLACGREAHFSWRDRLQRADAMHRAGTH